MDITIKITDQDNIVYEKIITLTEKFQATLPSTLVMETIFSDATESAQSIQYYNDYSNRF